jgi:anti-anti-sigma factor
LKTENIRTTTVETITVLVVSGRITSTECHGNLKHAVGGLIERGREQTVLELEAAPFVDSNGLGELVSSYASLVRLGNTLRLTNVNLRVADALKGAGLDSVLRIIQRHRPSGAQPPDAR